MNPKTLVAAVVLLGAGMVLGFYLRGEKVPAEELSEKSYRPTAPIKDKGDEASLKALKKRIRELEAQLRTSAEKAERTEEALQAKVKEGEVRRGPRNFREHLERLKKENPERYVSMTNRMARHRSERLDRAQRKLDFLSSVDTSRMSASARKTHDELQDLIARREELEERMHDEELSEESRGELISEMRSLDEQIRSNNKDERSNLLKAAAKELGFSGDDAEAVSETVQEIIRATEDGGFGGGRPPPPR